MPGHFSHVTEAAQALTHTRPEAPPLITERTAILCGLLFTAIFVAPFYLSSTLRTSSLQSRDAPTIIKARMRAVGLSCIVSTVVAVSVLVTAGHATPRDVLRLFAVWPVNVIDCFKVMALVAVLFVGPLYEHFIVDGAWRDLGPKAAARLFDSLPSLRNNVVAPWAEEWVFRSHVVSMYLLAEVPAARIVFTSPLIFGAAHIHHLVDFIQSHTPPGQLFPPANVWIMGLLRSLFQFTYTSLFGFFAAFVYLRTGSVFAAVTAHTFCNCMGFPRVTGKVGQHADEMYELTPDVAQGKRDDDGHQMKVGNSLMKDADEDAKKATVGIGAERKNLGILWTIVYYSLLFAGSYGFYKLLWPLTESTNALVKF